MDVRLIHTIESVEPPTSHLDLLDRAVIPHVATLLPDGNPRVTPTRFVFDGTNILFTTTPSHIVFRTLDLHRCACISLQDPDDQFRTLEIRAVVQSILPDPAALTLYAVGAKYNIDFPAQTSIPSDRVVIRMHLVRFLATSRIPA